MSVRGTVAWALGSCLLLGANGCIDEGPGSDFDIDGITDAIEDANENFAYDPGETDFVRQDTDGDGLCDGRPEQELAVCAACEDCNNDGSWDPCEGETDPLNDDTDNDGLRDGDDPDPLDTTGIDCTQGDVSLPPGASLPPGKDFPPERFPTPTPLPGPTPTPAP